MSIPIITTVTIDEAIQWLEDHAPEGLQFWEECLATHPALEAYLSQEEFVLLSAEEREFLVFVLTVVFKSVGLIRPLEEERLIAWENHNWAENLDKLSLDARLDHYFKDYPQEDLLAFAEDAIFDPDNDFLTKEGRLPLFVVVKTIIDAMGEAP